MRNALSRSLRGCSTLTIVLTSALLTCVLLVPQAHAGWLSELIERAMMNAERSEGKVIVRPGPPKTPEKKPAGSALHLQPLEKQLRAAYRSAALNEIPDASARERIRNVIGSHTTIQLASLAGREKQFASVADDQNYTMHFIYGKAVTAKDLIYGKGVTAKDKDDAYDRASYQSAMILRTIISVSSENVPISAFRSREQYRNALKHEFVSSAKELTELKDYKFKFSVLSGELEIPVSVKVGAVEVTAGSINLYEIAGKVADKLFSGSALMAAVTPDDSDQPAAQPVSSELVLDEENEHRQISTSLSSHDFAELLIVAPNLFAGQSE